MILLVQVSLRLISRCLRSVITKWYENVLDGRGVMWRSESTLGNFKFVCFYSMVTKDNIKTVCHMDSCLDTIRFIVFVPGTLSMGFPSSSDGKASSYNAGDTGLIPGLGILPCGRKCQPIPVFLPGEFHGQRNLAGYSPWGCKESDSTE